MGFFTGQNYGIAKNSSPSSYAKTTPKPPLYKGIKNWVHASDHVKPGVRPGGLRDSWSGFKGDVHWKDNPYAEEGWFPVWYGKNETDVSGNPDFYSTYKSPEQSLKNTAGDLSDPNSKYYKDFSDKLKSTLSAGTSVQSLLAFNKSMGLGTEASATIANEQNKANLAKINDSVIQATKDLYASNTGNAINANNSILNYLLGVAQMNQNQSQYNQTRKDSLWNQNMILLGNIPNQLNDIFGGNTKVNTWGWTKRG